MKTTQRKGRAAFTLIELMAVITIIVILAALVVGGLGYVTEKRASSQAKVQISLISKALEEYKMDMGQYPLTDDVPTVSSPKGTKTSAASLYEPLFYEGYDYAEKSKNGTPPDNWTKNVNGVTVPKSTKIYLPDLDPTATKQGWVVPVTGTNAVPPASIIVTDPWGNQYCYRTAQHYVLNPATPAAAANDATINPDFDLWSMGKDGKSNPSGNSVNDKKINADDIKN
ncbi:MAG: type II secretion system protein GspG [Luteolibacter sp.]